MNTRNNSENNEKGLEGTDEEKREIECQENTNRMGSVGINMNDPALGSSGPALGQSAFESLALGKVFQLCPHSGTRD